MAAAQQTTLPMMTAAAGPLAAPLPIIRHNRRDETSTVEMVTPEIGLLDEPTMPAMYAATAANRNPVHNMIRAMTKEIWTCWTKT